MIPNKTLTQYTVNGGEGSGGEYVSLRCSRCVDGFESWELSGYTDAPPPPTLLDLLKAVAEHEKVKHS